MQKTANLSGLRLPPWAVLATSVTIGLIAVVLMTREIAAQSDQLILKIAKEYDVAIAGATQEDRWGATVSVGDINSDGQDDLLIGAPGSGLDSLFRAGAALAFFGPIDSTVTESAQASIKLKGFDFTAGVGSAVLVTDIDEDGVNDLIISSEKMAMDDTRHESGVIHTVLGPVGETGASAVDLSTQTAFRIFGAHRNYHSGKGLASGDLNNDGTLDLVIGSPGGYELRKGGVEIVFGPFDGEDIDLRTDTDGVLLGATGDIASTRKGDGAGASVAIGDVTGDGIDDLIVNSRSAEVGALENAGESYIFFGPLETLDGELKSLADVTLQGNAAKDTGAESSLAIGDVNGDGTNDLVIGSMQSDASGRTGAGKVFVLQGPISAGTYDVESAAKVIVEGENAIDNFGSAVGVGDFNGDGVADLVAAASFGDPDDARTNAGITYIMYGNIFEREPTPEESNLPIILIGVGVGVVVIVGGVLGIWYLRRIRRGSMPMEV